MTLRHASFFTGVGGVDLGFHRAGMVTVSQCEIEPYASAVLAERYPGVPNLGDITKVVPNDIPEAEVWSGGFPCQDLSQAGKRAGFAAGSRSSLAFTFLNAVADRRPRWLVMENVTGLFSSNNGADFARLLTEVVACGFNSVAWRVFDARHFGVAQRRRRVFIVASVGTDCAQQVLFEQQSQWGNPATGDQAGKNPATGTAGSFGTDSQRGSATPGGAPTDTDRMRTANGVARRLHDSGEVAGQEKADTLRVGNFELFDMPSDAVSPSLNALRARDTFTYDTASPLVGYNTRADDKAGNFSLTQSDWANTIGALWPGDTTQRSQTIVAPAENVLSFPSRFGSMAKVTDDIAQPFAYNAGAPAVFRKSARVSAPGTAKTWVNDGVANTLNTFDVGDVRTTHAVVGGSVEDDPTLPRELDNHRYRCCGNGVVSPVAEWIGRRIVAVDAATDWGK
jgi:site-specific DNA-cytosine methylase